MADQLIQYTEEMVGAGHPTKSDTLNRLSLVEHNSDGTHKGKGASSSLFVSAEASGEAFLIFNPPELGDSSYNRFVLTGSRVIPISTGGVAPNIRLSQSSSVISTNNYHWSVLGLIDSSGTPISSVHTSSDAFNLIAGGNVGGETWYGLSFQFEIHAPWATDNHKACKWWVSSRTTTGESVLSVGQGYLANTTTAIDGIQFSFTANGVESGYFTLEGIRNS